MFVSCRRISSDMKRHLCRHCRLAVDTYAELKRHVESHSTPPSDLAKKTKYSCKCDATFERWDDLQHHVRTACRLTTAYTCTKCGKIFTRHNNRIKHIEPPPPPPLPPPPPKRSNVEDTTPQHPLVTDEDPLEPPDRLPFPITCRRNC